MKRFDGHRRGYLKARSKAIWGPGARPSDGQEQGQLKARSKAIWRPVGRPVDGQEQDQLTARSMTSWRPGARPADDQEQGQLTARSKASWRPGSRPADGRDRCHIQGCRTARGRIIWRPRSKYIQKNKKQGQLTARERPPCHRSGAGWRPGGRPVDGQEEGQLTARRKASWRPRCLERSTCWPWATCLQTTRRPVRQDPKLFSQSTVF